MSRQLAETHNFGTNQSQNTKSAGTASISDI